MKLFVTLALFFTSNLALAICEFTPNDIVVESRSAESFSLNNEIGALLKAGASDVCTVAKDGTTYVVTTWPKPNNESIKTVMLILAPKPYCSKNEIRSNQTNNFAADNYTAAVEELENKCPDKRITQPVWNRTMTAGEFGSPGNYDYGYWSARCDCESR